MDKQQAKILLKKLLKTLLKKAASPALLKIS